MMNRLRFSKAETHEREQEINEVQRESVRQRNEALSLLGMARVTGEVLRESRKRNHYGMLLNDVFNGRRRA